VVKQMKHVHKALGHGVFNMTMKIGNMPDSAVRRGMELFRDRVLPAVRDLLRPDRGRRAKPARSEKISGHPRHFPGVLKVIRPGQRHGGSLAGHARQSRIAARWMMEPASIPLGAGQERRIFPCRNTSPS
jgi:hypothetical protein